MSTNQSAFFTTNILFHSPTIVSAFWFTDITAVYNTEYGTNFSALQSSNIVSNGIFVIR
jgi:hypothetical protein